MDVHVVLPACDRSSNIILYLQLPFRLARDLWAMLATYFFLRPLLLGHLRLRQAVIVYVLCADKNGFMGS